MTVKEVLLAAAEKLERDGWCQGVMETKDGRCCALGAIAIVAKKILNVQSSAEVALRRGLGAPSRGVMGWNDAQGRTAEEVIAKLREVAEGL